MASVLQNALAHTRQHSNVLPPSVRGVHGYSSRTCTPHQMVYGGGYAGSHEKPGVYSKYRKRHGCNRGRVKNRGRAGRRSTGFAGHAGGAACCVPCANGEARAGA